MKMEQIPFGTTDWSAVEPTEHKGEVGVALWRTQTFGGIRVRMVEYTPGYQADHWCTKGHVLLCLEGELETVLEDGRRFLLKPGMSYQVADVAEPHRSQTATGAKLCSVDVRARAPWRVGRVHGLWRDVNSCPFGPLPGPADGS